MRFWMKGDGSAESFGCLLRKKREFDSVRIISRKWTEYRAGGICRHLSLGGKRETFLFFGLHSLDAEVIRSLKPESTTGLRTSNNERFNFT